MKRLFLSVPLFALLTACGSSNGPSASNPSSGDASNTPMMYVSSGISTPVIARCLKGKLSRVRVTGSGGPLQLIVGSNSNPSYSVTLTPFSGGTVIRAMHPGGEDPPEPEMRAVLARCAI